MDGRAHWSDGRPVLRFIRVLQRSPDEVWQRLVDPPLLAEWLGRAVVEPKVGGRVALSLGQLGGLVEGRVRRLEIGRLFEHSATGWPLGDGDGWVRWRLVPSGRGGTRLVLSHRVAATNDLPGQLAAWHLRLDLLLASFELGDTVWLPERLDRLRRHYEEVAAMTSPTSGPSICSDGSAPAGGRRTAGTGILQQDVG